MSAQTGPKTLDIYYIDTEGGQSTLFVSPTGESLLVDTGNAGDRDLDRIVETLDDAGVKQIDHMWTTHYHGDHVGRARSSSPSSSRSSASTITGSRTAKRPDRLGRSSSRRTRTLSQGKRTIVKPGDKVRDGRARHHGRVVGESVHQRPICPAAGVRIRRARASQKKDESAYFDPDNGDSAGFVLTFGKFRTIDLGDLTWNGELDLMCPTNRIGTVDLYLTIASRHRPVERAGARARACSRASPS